MSIRVATCVPLQKWSQVEKWQWLSSAIAKTDCDLFLLPQEYFGGGSMREVCRLKGIQTDDVPVTLEYLQENIGMLGATCHIGIGATVNRFDVNTEDYLYFKPDGTLLGHHSKMALPAQDSVLTNGASQVTPEADLHAAASLVEIPELGLRVGTVFCWQVFFNYFWSELKANKCNLVVHPIKFAPRAWYEKGQNPDGQNTRVGFTQNSGSKDAADDALGWIRKLKFESEFKELPIAVTCNSWAGGEKYLALNGFIEETVGRTEAFPTQSTADAERIDIHTYDPSLYNDLDHLSLAVYAQYKQDWQWLMQGVMRRKAVRIEGRTLDGKTAAAVNEHNEERQAKKGQPSIFPQE